MTDQPQTSIMTIDQALNGLADGSQTIQDIGAYLGGMWQDAIDRNDETAISYYQAAWDLANVLAASNEAAKGIIQTFGAQRDEAAAQRDAVTNAYASYQEAVINMDFAHPDAGRQLKLVYRKGNLDGHDEGWDEGYWQGGNDAIEGNFWEIVSNSPSEDFLNGIFNDFPGNVIDKLCDQAQDFALMLFADSDAGDIYSMELRQKVAAFIQEVHLQVLAERTAHEQRIEAQFRESQSRWQQEQTARAARAARVTVPLTDHLTEDDDYDDDNTDPDA